MTGGSKVRVRQMPDGVDERLISAYVDDGSADAPTVYIRAGTVLTSAMLAAHDDLMQAYIASKAGGGTVIPLRSVG